MTNFEDSEAVRGYWTSLMNARRETFTRQQIEDMAKSFIEVLMKEEIAKFKEQNPSSAKKVEPYIESWWAKSKIDGYIHEQQQLWGKWADGMQDDIMK